VQFYAAEILIALSTVHRRNVLYRDLKPENLMIDREGHIKLIDFGFAKHLEKSNSRAYTNCGTIGYIAPEVLQGGGYCYPADIWSFGILLLVLLTG